MKWASSNQKTFTMPSFYPALRTLGNHIYAQQRAELAAATTEASTEVSTGAGGVAAAVTTAAAANTAPSKGALTLLLSSTSLSEVVLGTRPTRGRKAPKTPEIVPDTDSDPDDVSCVTEDVTMSDGTGLSTAERLSLNKMVCPSSVCNVLGCD